MRPEAHGAPRDVSFRTTLALLLLAGMPDGMVVPVLRELLIERAGAGVFTVYLFMSVSVVGGFLGARLLTTRASRVTTRDTLIIAALANALLLAAMTLPIPASALIALRTLEGAADVAVCATLFGLAARSGPHTRRAVRMGAAATALMLGIAAGLALGGMIAALTALGALGTLLAGSLACLAISVLAAITRTDQPRLTYRDADALEAEPIAGPSWPAWAMMFTDRALGALFTATIPLCLATVADCAPAAIGASIGTAMLGLTLGAWPGGWIAERFTPARTRAVAATVYAIAIGTLPLTLPGPPALRILALAVAGLSAGTLFAASLALLSGRTRATRAFAGYYAAGNAGFLTGQIGAGLIIWALEPLLGITAAFSVVFVTFAIAHSGISWVALRAHQANAPGTRTIAPNAAAARRAA